MKLKTILASVGAMALTSAALAAADYTKTWPENYWSEVIPNAQAKAIPTPAEASVAPETDYTRVEYYFGAFDSRVGFTFVESSVIGELNVKLPGKMMIFY